MDLAALIIVVVGAGVAAAIGYFGVLAAERFLSFRLSPYLGAGAGAAFGGLVSIAVIGGWIPALLNWTEPKVPVEQVLPYMQLIKQHEPALYERIETSIIRDQDDGLASEQVRANARALVISYVADKTTSLPDQLTYDLFATTRDQMAYLAEHRDYEACADLALGRAKGDIDSRLSPELIERGDTTTARVISTPADPSVVKMPAEEFAQLASRSFAEASQLTGIPPEEVDVLLSGSGEPTKACKLMKAFFDALLAQPVNVAASALRALSSGERSPTQ
jgi:hypothetical protein